MFPILDSYGVMGIF